MTETEEPRYRPWGIVTPQFWARDPGHQVSGAEQLFAQAEQHATRQPPPPATPSPAPPPSDEPAVETPDDEEASPARSADATVTAAAEPADDGVPAAFHAQIKAIDTAIHQRRLGDAADRAASVDQQITAAYGPSHLHTINARELRGFIAHLSGDDITGCHWYLHTVGLRIKSFGTDDPGTRSAVREAVALWQRIQDPDALRRLGTEIVRVLTIVEGADSHSVRATRARLARADGNAAH